MPRKVALLIGVGEYEHPISPIPVVPDDIARMRQALSASGYEHIQTLATGSSSRMPTRNVIRRAIRDTLENADEGSTVFIYFSGHGTRLDGVDYICPSDTPPTLREDSSQDL